MKETEPDIKELSEFMSEFNGESDRGAVLAAAAYLDERLSEMLKSFFADVKQANDLLFGFNAPLGTYSSRINAAYSLGLIQENEFTELNIIRKIRNEFGHSWKGVSFKTQKIIDLCNNLPWLGPAEYEETSGAKERFSFEVAILLTDFLWRVRLIKQEKREVKEWSHKIR